MRLGHGALGCRECSCAERSLSPVGAPYGAAGQCEVLLHSSASRRPLGSSDQRLASQLRSQALAATLGQWDESREEPLLTVSTTLSFLSKGSGETVGRCRGRGFSCWPRGAALTVNAELAGTVVMLCGIRMPRMCLCSPTGPADPPGAGGSGFPPQQHPVACKPVNLLTALAHLHPGSSLLTQGLWTDSSLGSPANCSAIHTFPWSLYPTWGGDLSPRSSVLGHSPAALQNHQEISRHLIFIFQNHSLTIPPTKPPQFKLPRGRSCVLIGPRLIHPGRQAWLCTHFHTK